MYAHMDVWRHFRCEPADVKSAGFLHEKGLRFGGVAPKQGVFIGTLAFNEVLVVCAEVLQDNRICGTWDRICGTRD
jgi:hypothetical protein